MSDQPERTIRRRGKAKRQEAILRELRMNVAVRVSDLASRYGTSTETIRRDLDELTERGLINRTYGGAASTPVGTEPKFRDRHQSFTLERHRIARVAAALVEPQDVVMIDAGSTTLHFANALVERGIELTVITNCLPVAEAMARGRTVRVMLCPGEVNGSQGSVSGPETLAFLRRFHADWAFIGASGLTGFGVFDADSSLSWVKRAMIERARRTALLVDHSKLGQVKLETVCELEQLGNVVCDRDPGPELADALRAAGVELSVAA